MMMSHRQRHIGIIDKRLIGIVILAVLLGLLIPRPAYASDVLIPAEPPSVIGIEVTGAANEIDRVKAAGSGWTRIAGVWWPDVEPVEGQRNWDAMKWIETRILEAAKDHLQVVLVVRGTPSWAQRYVGVSCGPIEQGKFYAFARFMADLVRRYSQPPYSVQYWELTNEPDIDRKLVEPDSLWGCWGDDQDTYYGGGYYAAMLRIVYPRIKSVNRAVQVLVGGLVIDCDPRPNGGCPSEDRRRPARFLEGILRAGGSRYFDGIAFHAYDYYDGSLGLYSNKNFQSSSAVNGPVTQAKVAYIQGLLQIYRVRGKFLISTESALLCKTCNQDNEYEQTKALYAARVNASTLANHLRANIWFRLANYADSELVDSDLTPKPAYFAFQASARMLNGATFIRNLRISDTGNEAINGFLFRRGRQYLWVVWSTDGKPHTLNLRSNPRSVYDVYGKLATGSTGARLKLSSPESQFLYLLW